MAIQKPMNRPKNCLQVQCLNAIITEGSSKNLTNRALNVSFIF